LLAVDPAENLSLVPSPAVAAPAGVAVVFGSTYNGEFEDVEGIDKVLSGEWR
jgi:glutamate/tyrosine decarboxylase-like PLP-dependent enzyme